MNCPVTKDLIGFCKQVAPIECCDHWTICRNRTCNDRRVFRFYSMGNLHDERSGRIDQLNDPQFEKHPEEFDSAQRFSRQIAARFLEDVCARNQLDRSVDAQEDEIARVA